MDAASLLTPRPARFPVSIACAFVRGEIRAPVILLNVTNYGFMAQSVSPLEPGQIGLLALSDGSELAAEVRWVTDRRFGARFVPAIRTFTLGRILSLQPAERERAARGAR